jgi:hypothetical protein
MKSPVGAFLVILLATLTSLSRAAEMPYDPVHYEATRSSGKPFAVVFHEPARPTRSPAIEWLRP